jgi:3-oxoacyl-[acyl-carrier protein] reductase
MVLARRKHMNAQNQKVAVVTGASRGIGAAVAERLARSGFTVIVNYAESAAPAEALVRKIQQAGGKALTAKADVSSSADVRRLFDAAETAFGGVDVTQAGSTDRYFAPMAGSSDHGNDEREGENHEPTNIAGST